MIDMHFYTPDILFVYTSNTFFYIVFVENCTLHLIKFTDMLCHLMSSNVISECIWIYIYMATCERKFVALFVQDIPSAYKQVPFCMMLVSVVVLNFQPHYCSDIHTQSYGVRLMCAASVLALCGSF